MVQPRMLMCDDSGRLYQHPFLLASAGRFESYLLPSASDFMLIKKGVSFFSLPGRIPVGFNAAIGEFESVKFFNGIPMSAVAAFLPPGYMRLHVPAYAVDTRLRLPHWAYAACGHYGGHTYVSVMRIDRRVRQFPRFYNAAIIARRAQRIVRKYPRNRLYKHLAHCALTYNCLAAKNLFMERWEAPVPTARVCNAACLGCLSNRAQDCFSSHERIKFAPDAQELVEVMAPHLARARQAIVSFGQGCEGEPLLEADVIARAVIQVREKVSRGTIHMNTNASLPQKIALLCRAGVDSFRVSMPSPVPRMYHAYVQPRGYRFRDVVRSIEIAKKHNTFVSLNLFIYPGFSDDSRQIEVLIRFISDTGIDMLQCRNLNIDPLTYAQHMAGAVTHPVGMRQFLARIHQQLPRLKIGYFNLPKEDFTRFENVIEYR